MDSHEKNHILWGSELKAGEINLKTGIDIMRRKYFVQLIQNSINVREKYCWSVIFLRGCVRGV